jgi:hypothetical protein
MPRLRVDTAALQAMSTNWGAAGGDLTETAAPTTRLGLSSQPSAAALNAADADTQYIADDSHAVTELAAVTNPPTVV